MTLRKLRYLALPMLVLAAAGHKTMAAEPAPDFLGIDTAGHTVHVSALRGKLVIATFWASWCGSCLRELPALEGIQRSVGHGQLEVFAINYGETQQVWERIRTAFHDAGIGLLHDPGDRASDAFSVEEIPALILIDREGRIVYRHVGYDKATLDQLIAELQPMLAMKATPPDPR